MFKSCCQNCVMYICTPAFIAKINMDQLEAFLFILKRDCLRLFVVVYKLVMLMLCCWLCVASV